MECNCRKVQRWQEPPHERNAILQCSAQAEVSEEVCVQLSGMKGTHKHVQRSRSSRSPAPAIALTRPIDRGPEFTRAEKASVSAPGSLAEAHMVHMPACACRVEGDYLQSSHHGHHTTLGVGTLSARSERRLKMRRSAAGAAQGPRRRNQEASACSGRLGGWARRCKGCRPRQRQGRRRHGGTPCLALGRCRRRHLEGAAPLGAVRLG